MINIKKISEIAKDISNTMTVSEDGNALEFSLAAGALIHAKHAPKNLPAGTIQAYNSYNENFNKAVKASVAKLKQPLPKKD